MFDIGATELLVIAIVAILVVGPRELPRMLRSIGQMVSRAKGMAREFQTQFEDAAEEAGVNKLRDDISDIGNMADQYDLDEVIDPIKDASDAFNETIDVPDPAPTKPKAAKKAKAAPKKSTPQKPTSKKTKARAAAPKSAAKNKTT